MKKIISALIISIFLTGCSSNGTMYNREVIDMVYGFDYADIQGIGTVEVKSWCDYTDSDMIQITDKNNVTYLTHSSNVILYTKGK